MKVVNFFRFIYFFFMGLERNFKIINYGDVPEIYLSPSVQDKYSFANKGFISLFHVAKDLAINLLSPKQKLYSIPCADVIFCGASENNEKEFYFLSGLLSKRIPIVEYVREKNISFVKGRGGNKEKYDFIVSLLVYFLCVIYLLRIKINPTSYKYLLYFSKIYIQVYSSFRRCNKLPKTFIVANDHTDFSVVSAMMMKYFRVPVLYLQHAEISERFPPLIFDVSVLRNHKSLEKYKSIGRVEGDVFIIPRNNEAKNSSAVLNPLYPSPINVVVYLSSIYEYSAVQQCISILSANKFIGNIFIKRHPRSSSDFLKAEFGLDVLDEIPKENHIAIVPNSSVAIELLGLGIRVFQYFELDNIGSDYYGFVAEGITLPVTSKDLGVCFWETEFYDYDWMRRFSSYSFGDGELSLKDVESLAVKLEKYFA